MPGKSWRPEHRDQPKSRVKKYSFSWLLTIVVLIAYPSLLEAFNTAFKALLWRYLDILPLILSSSSLPNNNRSKISSNKVSKSGKHFLKSRKSKFPASSSLTEISMTSSSKLLKEVWVSFRGLPVAPLYRFDSPNNVVPPLIKT